MPEVANPFAQKHSYSRSKCVNEESPSWTTIETPTLGYTVTNPDDIRKKVIVKPLLQNYSLNGFVPPRSENSTRAAD
jgi:hypothetical protein